MKIFLYYSMRLVKETGARALRGARRERIWRVDQTPGAGMVR